ncbi:IPT/TIG domain-containing protein [Streptomyces sp. NPDC048636]|uniref:IPT/TIG domain-containing protein n=1 Tax=Streptomyces sp. NPDC048636 TaxID=3155762 RepID=UPI00343745E9
MATLTSLVDAATGTDRGKAGDTLVLTGSGLGGTTRVNIGRAAVAPSSVAPGTVTAIVPALCAGQHPVSVTAANSTSNALPFFLVPVPVVTGLSSSSGPAAATSVTLIGEGFLTATGVTFGAVGAATGTFPPPTDTALTVTAPAHATPIAGCTDTVDVTVTSLGGTSTPSDGGQYTYHDVPDAVSATPALQVLGRNVTITGTCLADTTSVVFTNGVTQTPTLFSNISATQLLAVVPSLSLGTYQILVTTPGGTDTATPPSVTIIL